MPLQVGLLLLGFPEVVSALHELLAGRQAVLDGELVVLGCDGRPDVERLRRRLGRRERDEAVTLVVFDVLGRRPSHRHGDHRRPLGRPAAGGRGPLVTGSVRASQLLRVLHGGGRPPLGRALAQVGRIAKTIFLLAYLDEEAYRRRILTQINRGEARHALAGQVFHGHSGELRQPYREGQEDRLDALGLVVNAIAL